jgi:hypothetical protein
MNREITMTVDQQLRLLRSEIQGLMLTMGNEREQLAKAHTKIANLKEANQRLVEALWIAAGSERVTLAAYKMVIDALRFAELES